MSDIGTTENPSMVSLEVVWADAPANQNARMSEISMAGCYIDGSVAGRSMGDIVEFKVHLSNGLWVALRGQLILDEYPVGCGLSFLGLTDSDKRLLAHAVFPTEIERQDSSSAECDIDGGSNRTRPGDSRNRILIADDDAVTLKLLVAIVEGEGHEAIAVPDGLAALRALEDDGALDAAIFDMTMPYAKGLDLINIMKANPKLAQVPIAMVTGERDPKVWDDSVAAGACVFLPKPFTPDQIRMLLRMLESKGPGRENGEYSSRINNTRPEYDHVHTA